MREAPPFHTTALHPVEYIPVPQDADGYRRRKTAQIRRNEQALERQQADLQRSIDEGTLDQAEIEAAQATLDQDREANAGEWRMMDQTLATMAKHYPVPQVFFISVPTSVEREQINSRLVSLGLTQVTQEQIRATMIEELFHQDWRPVDHDGEWTAAENDGIADDHANFLDGVWLRQEAHDAAIKEWQEQEIERIIDEAEGAPRRERAELPPKIITVREQSRMQLLVDRMMSQSQRLRDLAAANMDFGRRNAMLLVRMHVVGVSGFEPKVPLEQDRRTRALPEAAVNALREQVDDQSWHDLVGYIDRLYKVEEAERKNSDSLPEKPLPTTGSHEQSGAPAGSDGSSTGSSSTPAPAGGSEMTTDRSFGSTSGSSEAVE